MTAPSHQPLVFGAPMIPDLSRLTSLTAEALASGWLTNCGVLHMGLEKALAKDAVEGDAVSLVSSGTVALMLALRLGHLPAGGEVITTPLSFAATAQAIEWCGLKPVFADVDPVTLTLCPAAVRAAITARTVAMLPVHLFGVPCDVDALGRLAKENGLWLVYDSAHAFDVTFNRKPISCFGDASVFSLHATKILHTGEGGYVVTRHDRAAELRQLRNFGLERGRPTRMGLNGKMSELNAAMGLSLLPDLPAELETRRTLRQAYDSALGTIARLRLHPTRSNASASLGYYAIRLEPDLRTRLLLELAQHGILARDHFPLLCGPGTLWADAPLVTADGAPPCAPELGAEVLCLPLHGRMSLSDVGRVSAIIRRILGE